MFGATCQAAGGVNPSHLWWSFLLFHVWQGSKYASVVLFRKMTFWNFVCNSLEKTQSHIFNKISRDCINWQRPARYSRTFYEFSLEKKLEAQASSSGFYIIPSNSVLMLTFPALQISGNCIKRKINLNFYFHTFTIPKAFIKPFVAPQRSEKKKSKLGFTLCPGWWRELLKRTVKLVLVIICLGGRTGINCPITFLKILKLPAYKMRRAISIFSEVTRVIYPKTCLNQTCDYCLSTPKQQTLCVETDIV